MPIYHPTRQITEFLGLNGCIVSLQSVHKFLKKHAIKTTVKKARSSRKSTAIKETTPKQNISLYSRHIRTN